MIASKCVAWVQVMRGSKVLNAKFSSLRLAAALLLAGAAAGCSSDVSRFDGIFSSKPDTLTTSSIPHRNNAVNGRVPTPRANLQSGDDQALGQPYPENQDVSYDPVSTSTIDSRSAVNPMKVERAELNSPGVKA